MLQGDASASLFAASDYSAFGLNYRDFVAGVSATDPTGGVLLASYLTKIKNYDPTLPPAVVTNINLTGDANLNSDLISPYAVIMLPSGKEVALLNMLDPTYLISVSPHYAARTMEARHVPLNDRI